MINFIEVPVCAERMIQTGKSMSPQTSYIKLYTGRIADEKDSDLRYSEVPLKRKIKH